MKNKTELKNINKMAYPVLLNYLLMSVFEILDKAIVGHYSIQGFAVIGIAEAPIFEITGALGILSVAFNIIAAELKGRNDLDAFERTFDISRNLSLVIGFAFFLLSLVGGRFFFQKVYEIEGETLNELLSYFYPAALTVSQNMLVFLYSAYYRNQLNTRISFYSTAVATIVNLFFDASLVYGLFGLPQLGTAGAAWGSTIGLFAGLLVYQIPYYNNKNRHTVSCFENKQILKKLFNLYPSLFGQEFLESTLFVLIVSGVVAKMGTQQMAVYSLLVTVGNIVELPIYAYATAAQTYALQNKSAGDTNQAERYIKIGRQFTVGVIVGLSIFCFVCKTQMFGLIISDKTVIERAGHLLLWVLIIAVSKVTYQFYMGYLQGVGKEKYIFISAVTSTVISSIAVLLLGELFALSGIYFVMIGKYFVLSTIFVRKVKLLRVKTRVS